MPDFLLRKTYVYYELLHIADADDESQAWDKYERGEYAVQQRATLDYAEDSDAWEMTRILTDAEREEAEREAERVRQRLLDLRMQPLSVAFSSGAVPTTISWGTAITTAPAGRATQQPAPDDTLEVEDVSFEEGS